MTDKTEQPTDIAMLRVKFAINHFKALLLGDLHVPGKAQASATFELLNGCDGVDEITERTWQSWFSNPTPIPKIDKPKTLDKMAASKIRVRSRSGLQDKALPLNYFSHMMHGGLVSSMLEHSESKYPLDAMVARTNQYQPDSALHLHLDAIEICALSVGYGDISWETVKRIGAERILKLLADRWGPRHGSIYSELSSDLRLQWEAASDEEKLEIKRQCDRFKPSLFEYHMNAEARPKWNLTGIESDISYLHIYKLLFSLAADEKFLEADRLTKWCLDLATSALALHAWASSDRETIFTIPMSDEQILWIAFDEVLFDSTSLDAENTELFRAMTKLDADWNEASFEIFLRAREIYRSELSELGVSVNEVVEVAKAVD